MEKQVVREKIMEVVSLMVQLYQKTDRILESSVEVRRQTLSRELQKLEKNHQDGEISDAELNEATNYWLDNYSITEVEEV